MLKNVSRKRNQVILMWFFFKLSFKKQIQKKQHAISWPTNAENQIFIFKPDSWMVHALTTGCSTWSEAVKINKSGDNLWSFPPLSSQVCAGQVLFDKQPRWWKGSAGEHVTAEITVTAIQLRGEETRTGN